MTVFLFPHMAEREGGGRERKRERKREEREGEGKRERDPVFPYKGTDPIMEAPLL